ncbi:hypothetical protein L1987_34325 [Smallanthus sonchifolius]|uniref:Uncharacterized protein n=1 Tax=Smallanthus sonchifolius TaxID=185202 RepID=A0ACB9HTX4_9ASTR|nr:hypothetical protein L1987_34325 [Smallanthus sonchifolius]
MGRKTSQEANIATEIPYGSTYNAFGREAKHLTEIRVLNRDSFRLGDLQLEVAFSIRQNTAPDRNIQISGFLDCSSLLPPAARGVRIVLEGV